MPSKLPRLYVILDAGVLAGRANLAVPIAEQMYAAGVRLIQYRDKSGAPRHILETLTALRSACPDATLILNDRPDLAALAPCDGVHVGQEDLSPADARRVVGPGKIVGVSTHNEAQVRAADSTDADYIAMGPVFGTLTKENPDPVVGLAGVRRARELTAKPLVAIGGITRANARSVIDAGADSVALISGLFAPGETVAQVVRDFLDILR